jgi:hypothetical protein
MVDVCGADGLEVRAISHAGPTREGRVLLGCSGRCAVSKDVGPLFDAFRKFFVVESRVAGRYNLSDRSFITMKMTYRVPCQICSFGRAPV